MENLVNLDLDIKQEDADANNEMYSTKIIASKIYSIAELTDNTDADVSQGYHEVHPEKSGEEENVYEILFEANEEDMELSDGSTLVLIDEYDSASGNISFRVHIAQNHNGNELKESKDDKGHTDADCEVHLHKRKVHPEKNVKEENLYDNLFEVKEEDLELSSSDNFESDEIDKVQPNNDSACGKASFGQHIEQYAKRELQYTLLCPFCGLEFSDYPEWHHHLDVVHEFDKRESLNMLYTDDTVSCLECKIEMKLRNLTHLQRHRIVHLPYNQHVKCKLCAKCFQSAANQRRHMDRCHNEKRKDPNMIVLCPFCGKAFPDSNVWRIHLNAIHEFNKRESLNMLYTNDTVSCLECKVEMKLKSMMSLQRHRILHLPYNQYVKCKLCAKCFLRVGSFRKHMNVSHNEKRKDPNMILLCPFCGKEFPDSIEWRVHLNAIHEFNKRETLNMDLTKDKSKCLECNIEIKSKVISHLQQHRMVHLPYRRFVKCKLCEQFFDKRLNYRLHIVRCKRK